MNWKLGCKVAVIVRQDASSPINAEMVNSSSTAIRRPSVFMAGITCTRAGVYHHNRSTTISLSNLKALENGTNQSHSALTRNLLVESGEGF